MSDLLHVRVRILGLMHRLVPMEPITTITGLPHKRKLYSALHSFPQATLNVHHLFMGVDQRRILFCAMRGQYLNSVLFPLVGPLLWVQQ